MTRAPIGYPPADWRKRERRDWLYAVLPCVVVWVVVAVASVLYGLGVQP